MDQETVGLVGGITGAIIGVLGGAFGTYMGIKNTQGPRERAFMIRASILCWAMVTAFLVGLLLLPNPYRHLLWIPYAALLGIGIV
jgi:hypothetical protein